MNRDLAARTTVGHVCLDDLVTVLAEYPTDHRWNGWICPNLDAWSVVKVAEALDRAYADGTDQRGPEISWVDGDLVVTEYDGDEAFPETIPADASGLFSLGAYAWTWSADAEADALAEFSALVLAIGDGFHPDTRGDDYTSLPDGYTPERVDTIVGRFVMNSDLDPSGVANDLLDAVRDETGWTELRRIAEALGAWIDPHGLIHAEAEGEGRYVLVDRDVEFRVGLYERDRDLALVLIECPTVVDTIAAARALTSHWVEVGA
jgi:hypothetical protein